MKNKICILFFISFSINTFSQISNLTEKFILPNEVDETSGLIFYNDKIITHNDSGGDANLYEIDSLSGNLTRTITITNASNEDWEDIAQDETHIFIGDFGNNDGDRTDLKIYKILKDDYIASNSITATVISFSYEDQTDFSASNDHNFDAEALVVYDGNLLIFTKNRGNEKTNVYLIPKVVGNYTATKVSSYNAEGLITGATYNAGDDSFMLCGYNTDRDPFLVYVSQNNVPAGNDIFYSGAQKIDLTSQIGEDSQIEGITFFDNEKYYLSRESRNASTQKLYQFTSDFYTALSVDNNLLSKQINIYPNPTNGKLFIDDQTQETIDKIEIFNSLGQKQLQGKRSKSNIDLTLLPAGVYFVKIYFNNKKQLVKKIIKH